MSVFAESYRRPSLGIVGQPSAEGGVDVAFCFHRDLPLSVGDVVKVVNAKKVATPADIDAALPDTKKAVAVTYNVAMRKVARVVPKQLSELLLDGVEQVKDNFGELPLVRHKLRETRKTSIDLRIVLDNDGPHPYLSAICIGERWIGLDNLAIQFADRKEKKTLRFQLPLSSVTRKAQTDGVLEWGLLEMADKDLASLAAVSRSPIAIVRFDGRDGRKEIDLDVATQSRLLQMLMVHEMFRASKITNKSRLPL